MLGEDVGAAPALTRGSSPWWHSGGAGPLHARTAIAPRVRASPRSSSPEPGRGLGHWACYWRMSSTISFGTYIKLLGARRHRFHRWRVRGFRAATRRALLERRNRPGKSAVCLPSWKYAASKGDLNSRKLKVAADPGPISVSQLQRTAETFHELHERTYGHSFPGEPVEIVNLRLTAQGVIPKPRIRRAEEDNDRAGSAEQCTPKATAPPVFQDADGFVSTPTYEQVRSPGRRLRDRPRHPGGIRLDGGDSSRIRRECRCLRRGSPRTRAKLAGWPTLVEADRLVRIR